MYRRPISRNCREVDRSTRITVTNSVASGREKMGLRSLKTMQGCHQDLLWCDGDGQVDRRPETHWLGRSEGSKWIWMETVDAKCLWKLWHNVDWVLLPWHQVVFLRYDSGDPLADEPCATYHSGSSCDGLGPIYPRKSEVSSFTR